MFIWSIFYFIACCPFSGHWEKPCLPVFLPVKSLTRCPLGFLFDQDPSPCPLSLLSCPSPPWTHSSTSRFVLGAPGEAPPVLSRGAGAHLPRPVPPEPAQHPVGILGKNRAQEGVSSPCFCVTHWSWEQLPVCIKGKVKTPTSASIIF